MGCRRTLVAVCAFVCALAFTASSHAGVFFFSTGSPDGKVATASRPGPSVGANPETESADDFLLNATTTVDSATFTGLVPTTVRVPADISQVRVEIYRIFPADSDTIRPHTVPTRTNSPSDVELSDRDSALGGLSFVATTLAPIFVVANTVDAGIHPSPDQLTHGEGPATGTEVQFAVSFSPAIVLPAGHYFFVPQVLLADPNDHFLWLSAPKPIVPPGTPFTPDLQTWIRNAMLDPDWLRVGTDVIGLGTFNAAFSLTGTTPDDTTPPVCRLTAVVAGPPKEIQVTVQDTGSGLASIVPVATNATVTLPVFAAGSTAPQVVLADKVDPAQSSSLALTITDAAGNVTKCDPVLPGAPQKAKRGRRARTHAAVPAGRSNDR